MNYYSDKYWHIQMHLPEGKDGTEIDPTEMLSLPQPVIGTGEWENKQCVNFKSLPIGTILMVRRGGGQMIALCKITSETYTDDELEKRFLHVNYRNVAVLGYISDEDQPTNKQLFSQGTLSSCGPWTDQWKYIDKIISKLKMKEEIDNYVRVLELKKNIILQGAPGTGKTYTTASIAVRLCNKDFADFSDHSKVMAEYERLQDEGQIAFCTFHQSMDYEDFVEGLKPVVSEDGGGITYEVEDGLFKSLCQRAQMKEGADIISCIDTYLESIKGYENRKTIPTLTGKSQLNVWWKEGNKTISSRSTFSQSEKEDYSPSPLNIEKVKLQAIGDGKENNWPSYAAAFINAVKREYQLENQISSKPYVLIIDEINRGNVSKIFGELITLLEADKRSGGGDHHIRLTLPYSKESFAVPANLYIIGTMNTTDRSTGSIDYAVRRRFAFVTLEASAEVIRTHVDESVRDLAISLFEEINGKSRDDQNSFIYQHKSGDFELEDLMIGHSYFMADDIESLRLKMRYEVVPLIKEYIKDGILRGKKDDEHYFSSWMDAKCYLTKLSEDSEDLVE